MVSSKIVGISKALDLTFSGRIIESKEALDISLISSIHKPENLIDDAIHIAQELVEKSAPISIAITRQMLWRSFGQTHPYDAHVIESKAIDSKGHQMMQRGVNSFLEKRPAKFRNLISSDMPDFFLGGMKGIKRECLDIRPGICWYNKQDWL